MLYNISVVLAILYSKYFLINIILYKFQIVRNRNDGEKRNLVEESLPRLYREPGNFNVYWCSPFEFLSFVREGTVRKFNLSANASFELIIIKAFIKGKNISTQWCSRIDKNEKLYKKWRVDTIGNCQRLAFTVGVSQHYT